jgi:penicillin-binding protein 2
MARFYSLVANGGKLVQPTIVSQIEHASADGDSAIVVRRFAPPKPRDIGLDQAAVRVVQEGLFEATHAPYGTAASVFGGFPRTIAGKTGTTEKYVELQGFKGLRDQSWFCGYGPYGAPELVVCAVIENGGHGGEAAAPTTLKVFERFFGVQPGSYPTGAVETD